MNDPVVIAFATLALLGGFSLIGVLFCLIDWIVERVWL